MLLLASIACFAGPTVALALQPQRLAMDATPPSPVNAAVRQAVEKLAAGEPHAVIADELEATLSAEAADGAPAESPETREVLDSATALLRDLRRAAQIQKTIKSVRVGASIDDLAAALIDSKLTQDLLSDTIRVWVQQVGSGVGEEISSRWMLAAMPAEFEQMEPAYRLYKRGREAVPALVDLLEDSAATRAVVRPSDGHSLPHVVRRQDIALAVIEAITRCGFHRYARSRGGLSGGMGTLSLLPDPSRHEVVTEVREWWSQTRDLSPAETLSHRIEHAAADDRMEMIQVLVAWKEREAAIRHLRTLMEEATVPHQSIAAAQQLLQLGDPVTLDRLRVRLENARTPEQQVLALLVQHGGRAEFELLQRLVANDIAAHPDTKQHVADTVLNVMASSNNPLCLPVLVEALDSRAESSQFRQTVMNTGAQPPKLSDVAAERIQSLVGTDFNYRSDAPAISRSEAIERIQQWWQTEGRGRFGFNARDARKRGGIR